jgi:UDP-N-acetylglucosamine:LPS N-acetylglucosamine transferase
MAELIRACDVVVQNAGGLTASEALACGVSVMTYRCLPGHGRTNAEALDADGSVPWIRSPDDLRRHLASVLAVQPTVRAVPEQPVAEVTR